MITPFWFFTAVTAAPTSGANPKPFVDPNDTITPPLGSWFLFTSSFDIIKLLLLSVIVTLVTYFLTIGNTSVSSTNLNAQEVLTGDPGF